MTSYMPALRDTKMIIGNLRQARNDVGSGGGTGETFLKVDDKTGAMTFGQEGNPFPPGGRYVVGLHSFCHGYVDMQDGQVAERNVVPMAQQSQRPVPKGGSTTKVTNPDKTVTVRHLGPGEYGTYEGGGPRDVTEILLNSIDEPGFNLVFTAWGVSAANRIRNLLDFAVLHTEAPDGEAGFIHPVIVPKSSKYYNKKWRKDVWHFDYDVVDWLHNDGTTLLTSRGGGLPLDPSSSDPYAGEDLPPAPWEDEEMSAEERDLLRA